MFLNQQLNAQISISEMKVKQDINLHKHIWYYLPLNRELYVPQMSDTHYKGIGKNPNYPRGFALLYKRQCFCNVNTVD